MPLRLVQKTKPWFGGGAVGFILSKPIVRDKVGSESTVSKVSPPPSQPKADPLQNRADGKTP